MILFNNDVEMLVLNKPISIEWDIFYSCNFKCLHCRNGSIYSKEFKDESYYKHLINRMSLLGSNYLTIGGGEPFLYSKLLNLIDYGDSLGFKCRVLSNGWFIEKNLHSIMESNIWGIQISLDGLKSTHEHIRGVKGSFDIATNAIRLLAENGVNVVVSMTINSLNYLEVETVAELCRDLGATGFGARPVICIGNSASNNFLDLNPIQYKESLAQIYKLQLRFKGEFPIKCGDPLFSIVNKEREKIVDSGIKVFGGCDIGLATLRVDPYGNVTPCSMLPNFILGNVFEDNLKNIWKNSPSLKVFRNKEKFTENCATCKFKYMCGGCRARALSNGNILGNDPKCFIK